MSKTYTKLERQAHAASQRRPPTNMQTIWYMTRRIGPPVAYGDNDKTLAVDTYIDLLLGRYRRTPR